MTAIRRERDLNLAKPHCKPAWPASLAREAGSGRRRHVLRSSHPDHDVDSKPGGAGSPVRGRRRPGFPAMGSRESRLAAGRTTCTTSEYRCGMTSAFMRPSCRCPGARMTTRSAESVPPWRSPPSRPWNARARMGRERPGSPPATWFVPAVRPRAPGGLRPYSAIGGPGWMSK